MRVDSFSLFNPGLIFTPESLVYLQRDDDGRECDAGRVEPGAAVWRGGRRPRRHGKALQRLSE